MNVDKSCFIITPIGSNESTIRRATEGLIEAVIIPALVEVGFNKDNINVAHRISESGSINRQIIKKIIEDDLAIVNLTGLNPNVMYELAVRHAIAKPLVMLAEEGTNLPFDIVDQRTIFYKNDMLGVVQLKEDLINFVHSVLANEKVENPLIQLIQENNALNNVTSIDKSAVEMIFDRLDRLESNIIPKKTKKNHTLIMKFTLNNQAILTQQESDNIIKNLQDRIIESDLSSYLDAFSLGFDDDGYNITATMHLNKSIRPELINRLALKDLNDDEISFVSKQLYYN